MSEYFTISHESNGTAILTLTNKAGNSLKYHMIHQLMNELNILKHSCNGLIITSSLERTFCSGMDLNELCPPKRLNDYLKLFESLWFQIYSLPIPVIAAINGYAIAGGCALAICCDYRFIIDNAKIGLTSANIGFTVPKYIFRGASDIIGVKIASRMVTEGTLLSASEAYNIGLVDDVASDNDKLMVMSQNKLEQLIKINKTCYGSMKTDIRSILCKEYEPVAEELREKWIKEITDDNAQRIIREKIMSIGSKRHL